jgi:peptidoglycan/LPS O-acetylase OafA/YrhL
VCNSASPNVPGHADVAGHPTRIPSIDGLRAVAILLVIFDHYTPWIVTGNGPVSTFVRDSAGWGGTGVDLFFVLSGFLITGILVDSKGSSNYFGRFYWRRSLRIFPAYYAFLVPVLFMSRFFTGIGRPWFVFYLRNWRGADSASDVALGHLWSLAVEEQFYIGWSIIVFLVAARLLPHVTVALITLAPAVRAAMGYFGYTAYEIFRVTPARMDSLLLGALVALMVRSSWKSKLSGMAWLGILVSTGSVTLMRVFMKHIDSGNWIVDVLIPFLSPLLYASILALCLKVRAGGVASAVLTNPFFREVAKYSYAIYLFHLASGRLVFKAYLSMGAWFPAIHKLLTLLFIPVAFAVVFGLAAISWRFIEGPALSLKDRFFRAVVSQDGNVVPSYSATSELHNG